MQDLRQSEEFAHYMEKIGWKVEESKIYNVKCKIYFKKIPLLGWFAKITRPQNSPNTSFINQIAKKHKAFAVKIDYSPTKTLRLDLTKSENEILKQMKKDCRYEIRKAQKNKIIVKQSVDIESFIKMWHKNALHRGFWIPFGKEIKSIYEAFGKKAYLLLVFCSNDSEHDSNPLAGSLILIHDCIASYFHAASTPKGRKLSAPYLVVWEAIKLAKKKRCQVFDFEGIYDERFPIKSWRGFTHFKKSFGGKEVEYPSPIIKFYNPVLILVNKLLGPNLLL